MKEQSMEFKELVYDLMQGAINLKEYPVPEAEIVQNEYAEGARCYQLYGEVFEANRRLCERLGVQEDRDIELIIDNLLEIGKILGLKMFDYGNKFSNKES